MKIKKIGMIVVLLILIGAGYLFYKIIKPMGKTPPVSVSEQTVTDVRNGTYVIEGENIVLVNGVSEKEVAPGSAEKINTEYFGNEVSGDFNNDSIPDRAFLLVQSGGGTGAFYYVVAALGTPQGFKGTNGILLGDRIAPQTTEFKNGEIIVNYADRKPDESFSEKPSVGISRYFKINGEKLIEVQK